MKGKCKGEYRWGTGIWLGIREESGEHIIGTQDGVVKSPTIRSMASKDDSWNWDEFMKMKGLPWEPIPGKGMVDIRSRIVDGSESRPVPKDNEVEEPKDRSPNRAWIMKEDVRIHGPTPRCQGCRKAMLNTKGIKAKNHTEGCRIRFMELFRQARDPRALEEPPDEQMSSDSDSLDSNVEVEYNPDVGKKYDSERPRHPDDTDNGMEEDEENDEESDQMAFQLGHDSDVQDKIREMKVRMNQIKNTKSWKDDVERMHRALEQNGIGCPVMEIFSPSRVNGIAPRLGIMKGWSLDLTTNDPLDGQPWDFNVKSNRARAMDMLLSKQALLVIGSPMCKAFSQLQNWNLHRMDPQKRDAMMR